MPKQILIIDDDHNAVKYLTALLGEHGYDPVTASDGAEGLQKIQQAKPDLIVLDVMMPKKSGFVLFKQLKQDNAYKDIPILMLTGVAGVLEELKDQQYKTLEKPYDSLRESLKKKIDEMRELGLVRPEMFMDKPVDPDAFIIKVRELLGG
ncbi:MAG: response regulator [Planctomycetota bacterium]|jgi:CheY-like chemotaxis protein